MDQEQTDRGAVLRRIRDLRDGELGDDAPMSSVDDHGETAPRRRIGTATPAHRTRRAITNAAATDPLDGDAADRHDAEVAARAEVLTGAVPPLDAIDGPIA